MQIQLKLFLTTEKELVTLCKASEVMDFNIVTF